MEGTPSQTLYVSNLDDKVSLIDLKGNLFELFIPFGEILGIEARVTKKMRGQAFIVFKEQAAATNALSRLQGFVFMEKPIKIEYARAKSDAVSLLDGTYKSRRHIAKSSSEQKVVEAS
eukprot:Blabericola_migrator_1__1380@NODE_1359_length_4725_cov_105_142121_g912_i0_p6_GENE_NODE_1359_length_4725_cov_105_142121_g912_i0NODE_1359_length_4725_cov_105_142121_g912_i0_p6_ORF_typecomplete_len118_score20_49RRM_5/PF13893_6/1_2e12RRM_1/PF00076_22/2_7e12RRM_1/PF00076_22/1_1e04Limkainb1/PF11608_8/4_1e06RRM_occluded/PF16842_5/0_016RRM_8/PF11835_8/0_044DUF4523/PF15023_6/0_053PHM7_cyt/PF14703_6/0_18_NODE_1359_length_4725_cov_105_142121_g912_i039974350